MMTKPKSAPRGRKSGRPAHDAWQVYIGAEATSKVSGLSINALTEWYSQTVVSQDRCLREWPIIGGKSVARLHSKVNVNLFKFAKKLAKRGAPDLLRSTKVIVDRVVDEYIEAQGPEWLVSVKAEGDAIREELSRRYRREGVRHVKPRKPVPDK